MTCNHMQLNQHATQGLPTSSHVVWALGELHVVPGLLVVHWGWALLVVVDVD